MRLRLVFYARRKWRASNPGSYISCTYHDIDRLRCTTQLNTEPLCIFRFVTGALPIELHSRILRALHLSPWRGVACRSTAEYRRTFALHRRYERRPMDECPPVWSRRSAGYRRPALLQGITFMFRVPKAALPVRLEPCHRPPNILT